MKCCIPTLSLLCLLSVCFTGLVAQTNESERIYKDYLSIKDPEKKIRSTPETVQLLGDHKDFKKASALILQLESQPLNASRETFRKGVVLLSKALLSRLTDSTDQSMRYAREAAPCLKDEASLLAEAYSLLLMCYYTKGQFDSTVKVGTQVLPAIRKSHHVNSELEAMMCIGRSYDFLGNRKKGIEVSLEAIDLAKLHKKDIKLSELYISMSTIYKGEDIKIAKRYSLQALDVLTKSSDKKVGSVINAAYLMLGNVYYDLKAKDSAMYYYERSKEASLKAGDRHTYLSAIGNIGNVYYEQGDYEQALEYNQLTLAEYKKIGINSEIAVAYGSLADIYKDMKAYKKAILYYDSALVMTKKIQSADDYIYNYKGLSETYEMTGDYKEAFKYYRLYRQWNDSINNNQNSKKITQMELDYRYKAEQKEKDLIQENKDLVTQEKISRQKYIIWGGISGSLLLLGFLAFSIKTGMARKKTNAQLQAFNDEITRQKDIIEEKNHEITDSITYASRIQQGVIPDDQEMKQLFPQHFVFFKPRDIVSGDFYWANRVPNSHKAVIAVADCTGHGVPGAFMSLVGNTLLNQTLSNPAITNPAQALDDINQQLPKTIKSKSSTGTIKDGMEIAMCEFDTQAMTLHFSGANSNIYLVRNGLIQIYKGDKQPIGESASGNVISYTNHTISLQKNDCIYMITDGFADQFGGEKGKKFKYKPLEDLFCAVSGKNPEEQQAIISRTFNNWRLNHEQVDDVLVLGIKV